ncbi:MAG: helix-turn-helix domain-containing protein [Terriglobales bacterium]
MSPEPDPAREPHASQQEARATLGERLRALREAAGLDPNAVEERLNFGPDK